MINRNKNQAVTFSGYQSLNLASKIYQRKALGLIDQLRGPTSIKRSDLYRVLELGSADNTFLDLVCQKTGGVGTGLDIVRGDDLEKPLKIKAASYDLVIALEIIEHLYDTDFFLAEIKRVLKPKGNLILSTPNLASLNNRLRLLFGFYPKYLEYSLKGAGHIHLYTPGVLKSQILNLKFKIVRLTSPNFFCPVITKPWFPEPLRRFFMFLGDLFPTIGSHILIVARRE